MAAIDKYAGVESACRVLIHNNRTPQYHSISNPDIVPQLSKYNYSLSPKRTLPPHEYFKQRLSEVYVYPRQDVVKMAEIICTLPEEISLDDLDAQREFFAQTYDFLAERYGGHDQVNILSCTVHVDEGIRKPAVNRFTGEVIYNEDGSMKMELISGRPHLHFDFMPCVDIDLAKEQSKKRYDPQIVNYTEKVCASEVLSLKEYKHLHNDWQDYLFEHGVNAIVHSGRTKKQGGNITVEQYKTIFRHLQAKIDRLEKIEREYKRIIQLHPEYARDDGSRSRF